MAGTVKKKIQRKRTQIKSKKKNDAKPEQKSKTVPLFAVIRVRGTVNVNKPMKDTMEMLRLRKINNCIVVPADQTFKGMLKKAESFLAWGEIDQETLEKLVWKRGRLLGDKRLEKAKAKSVTQKIIKDKSLKEAGIKPVFRLTPPSKGHKPIRRLYPKGACGYRGGHINELIKRMI